MAFRKSSKAQSLKLLTVELALNNDNFVLTEKDADILIQVRSNSVMWHKEKMLNIAIKNLPIECTKICWLDCDLIFHNSNWVKETSKLLNKHDLVQPFSIIMQTNKKGKVINQSYGFGYHCKNAPHNVDHADVGKNATWGFAWASKKSYIEKCGGFYDKNIVGGGDNIIKVNSGFTKLKPDSYSSGHLNDLNTYFLQNEQYKLKRKNISCTSGSVVHQWHGDHTNRGYGERYAILKECEYEPLNDIQINDSGCYEFTSQAKSKMLEEKIKIYFDSRKEDG